MATGAELGAAGIITKYGGLIISGLTFLIGGKWFWGWKKDSDDKLKSLDKRLDDIEKKNLSFLTEEKTQQMIDKANAPLYEKFDELKNLAISTNEAVINLTRELAIKNAVDKALAEKAKEE